MDDETPAAAQDAALEQAPPIEGAPAEAVGDAAPVTEDQGILDTIVDAVTDVVDGDEAAGPEATPAEGTPAETTGDATAGTEDQGVIESIVDAVTDAVDDVVGGNEAAGPETEPAEGTPVEAGGDAAAETDDQGIIESIVDAVTDVVGGDEAAEPEPATTETTGVAEEPVGEEHHEGIAPETWLILALIALIVIAFRPAKRAILGSLDGRAGRIRNELDEAHRLREEAQAALANFQRRQRDAMSEAEEIIGHARVEAERLRERVAAELDAGLKRREAIAMDRIAQAETAALAEVRAIAVDVSVAAARELIASQLDKNKADGLIDQAINDLPGKLH